MRHIPGLYWFPILYWIFLGVFGKVLVEVADYNANNNKHSHLRSPNAQHSSNVSTLSSEIPQENQNSSNILNTTTSATLPNLKHYFLSPNYTLIQAQTLTTAVLHCEISELGNSTVTWKRRRDFQILTFGLLTYSSDIRFFTRNLRNGKDWSLHIRNTNTADAGLYECQISSHPPSSIFIELQLLEAHAEILGGPDKVVQAGSTLLLTCIVRRCTEIPEYIFWYHEQRMINYDHHVTASTNYWPYKNADSANFDGTHANSIDFNVKKNWDTEVASEDGVKLLAGILRHHRQSSELLIGNASERHSGNYSCVPSKAKVSSVTVHVLRVEKPAAMQHNKNSSSRIFVNNFLGLTILYLNFLR